MPDGEICKGHYSTVAEGYRTRSSNFNSYQGFTGYSSPILGMSNGQGRSSVLRNDQRGTGVATGDKGRVITFDYTTNANNHGHGTARDNRGNYYKVIF
jgi:hypothetical protein